MLNRVRSLVAPLYLFACLVLGGSVQGIWQNMILQLAGVAIIAWAACERNGEAMSRPVKQLLVLAITTIALVAVQMMPLPADIWSQLGPRQRIAHDFHAVGIALPSRPLSMTPAEGLASLLAAIPALAILCAITRLRAYRPVWLAMALILGSLAGIALGALQIASFNGQPGSPWYLYQDTNWGRGVGFFANSDHMATLLIVIIPFIAAIAAIGKTDNLQRNSALVAIVAGLVMVVMIGLVLNGSLAGYGLALPVLVASAFIILPISRGLRLGLVALVALFLVGSVVMLETTSIGSSRIGTHATAAAQSRSEILRTTSKAAADFMPFGSGLGSFRAVYQLYENPNQVTTDYVVHAHNDYAEVALELGLAGVILILAFLSWWVVAVWRVWRTVEAGAFARAASIASAAILVHSVVDFPLRTAAISACFVMCVSLLTNSRGAPRPRERNDVRPPRHVVI